MMQFYLSGFSVVYKSIMVDFLACWLQLSAPTVGELGVGSIVTCQNLLLVNAGGWDQKS